MGTVSYLNNQTISFETFWKEHGETLVNLCENHTIDLESPESKYYPGTLVELNQAKMAFEIAFAAGRDSALKEMPSKSWVERTFEKIFSSTERSITL